jgi:hypothetical protein
MEGGGANRPSLMEAQKNVVEFGYSIHQRLGSRRQSKDGQCDPTWRTIDTIRDNIELPTAGIDYGTTYPSDPTALYYWRTNYWRKR